MYYTYVLESAKDHQWYTGITADLRTRMANHVKGKGQINQLSASVKACLSKKRV